MSNALQTIVDTQRTTFLAAARPGGGFDSQAKWVAESGFAMQIMTGNSFLMDVALKNPASIKAAITNVAAIGISLNPAGKEAYLIPRKGVVCLDISYMGLLKMAMQDGCILWGQARVVRETDVFEMQGISQEPVHKYAVFATDRGPVVGAYVVVKLPNGDFLTHAMPISAIESIRNRSESWKKNNGPWVTDTEEMMKKTVIKQASKTWPKSERLDAAIQHLDTDGGEGIVFVGAGDQEKEEAGPITDAQVEAIESGLLKKGKTWDQLRDWCAKVKSIARDVPTISALTEAEATQVISKALGG